MLRPDEVERLSQLLAGELSDDESLKLHAEMERRPELLQAFERLTSLDALTQSMPPPAVDDLVARTAVRVARPPRSRLPLYAIAAALFTAAAAWLISQQLTTPTNETAEARTQVASVTTLGETQLFDEGRSVYRLVSGTAVVSGEATVHTDVETLQVNGRALITTEPEKALLHVTDLVTPTPEVTDMMNEAKTTWAGAVLAVMVLSGQVQAAEKVAAGKTYAKQPVATKTANAPPQVVNARLLPNTPPPAKPSDSISFGKLNAAVLAQGSAMSACYEKARKVEPELKGDLTLLITVQRNGTLEEVTAAPESTLKHPLVTACVLEAMKKVKYPELNSLQSATISYTLGFGPRGESGSELTMPAGEECEKCVYINDRTEKLKVDVGNSPSTGPADAKVTVVLFSEAECSFCIKSHEVLKQLIAEYAGKVRFVYKHHPLPMHKGARPAAIALQAAAAQGKFWQMLDVTYNAPVSPETGLYDAQARSLGMDLQQYRRDVENPATAAAVDADAAQAKSLDVKGVPAWFINGQEVVGHRPIETMREMINAALK